jgi:predicted  nucleic acid-binding Zn-ribbon protein
MLESIEKLLILQDSDRRLIRLHAELADIDPQRRLVLGRKATAEQEFEKARHQGLHLESERKKLELEVEARKELIAKYSAQQWQTRKNEEYKALSHEIETCKGAIRSLDDQQIGLMEQIEAAEKHTQAATATLRQARADADLQLQQYADAETRLRKQLAEAEAVRARHAQTVDPLLLTRYERILKSKGDKVVVDIVRGVCGGCHMKLARQDVINCQADREIVQCTNCGRILYYTRDMDVKPLE